MIRINLLTGAGLPGGRRPRLDVGQRVTVACSVILVVTLVAVGWRFWSLRQQAEQLTRELRAADQEIARLAPVLDQVRVSDARRAQLAQRVDLIEELRRGQGGSVRMLDEVSRALPEGVWLSSLEQRGGLIVLVGQALTLASLSDFAANLETSGYFRPPVEIVDGRLDEAAQRDVVQFELHAVFQLVQP